MSAAEGLARGSGHSRDKSRKELQQEMEDQVKHATVDELMATPRLDDSFRMSGIFEGDENTSGVDSGSEQSVQLPGTLELPDLPRIARMSDSFNLDSLNLDSVREDESTIGGDTGRGRNSSVSSIAKARSSPLKDAGLVPGPIPSPASKQVQKLRASSMSTKSPVSGPADVSGSSPTPKKGMRASSSARYVVEKVTPARLGRTMKHSPSAESSLSAYSATRKRTVSRGDQFKTLGDEGKATSSSRLDAVKLAPIRRSTGHRLGQDEIVDPGLSLAGSMNMNIAAMGKQTSSLSGGGPQEFGLDAMRNDVQGTQQHVSMVVPKRDQELGHLMKRNAYVMLGLAIAACIVAVIQLELSFFNRNQPHVRNDILKGVISVLSFVHCYYVILYNMQHRERQSLKNIFLEHRLALVLIQPSVVAELLVVGFHIPPGVDRIGNDESVDKYNAFLLLRMYTLLRVFEYNSIMSSTAGKFARLLSGVRMDFILVYKTWLFQSPFTTALCSLGVVSAMLGYWVYVFERELLIDESIHFTYLDATYLVLITMSTVGYGDIVAISEMGKVLCVVAAVLGLTFSALMVTIMNSRLHMNRKQQQVVSFLTNHSLHKQLENLAARSIQAAFRVFRERKALLARSNSTLKPKSSDDDGGQTAVNEDGTTRSSDGKSSGDTDRLTEREMSFGLNQVEQTQGLRSYRRKLASVQSQFVQTKRVIRDGAAVEGPVTVERVYEDVRRVGQTVDNVNTRLTDLEDALERLSAQTYTISFQSDAASATAQNIDHRMAVLEDRLADLTDMLGSKMDRLIAKK